MQLREGLSVSDNQQSVPQAADVVDSLQVDDLVRDLASQLESVVRNAQQPCLIGIQRRGDAVAHRLGAVLREGAGIDLPIGTLDITLYRDDFDSLTRTPVVGQTDIPFAVDDRTVILVDDVLYTGRTIRAALDEILEFGRAARIILVVLVDRGWRELPIAADFPGCVLATEYADVVQVRVTEVDGHDEIRFIPAGEHDRHDG
jgi:pyrimidine operon attenuation protein / uracil phosphoribosyltransferase